jgi:DNA primase
VGRNANTQADATPRTDNSARSGPTPKRSLVRSAIALLIQQPALVQAMEPPYLFSALRQPGIPLLMELIALCQQRPDIKTSSLLEHFAERDEHAALQKLALLDFPAAPEHWKVEFLDALEQLNRQTVQQRIDELLAKQAEFGLSEIEKTELRECLVRAKR